MGRTTVGVFDLVGDTANGGLAVKSQLAGGGRWREAIQEIPE
ncbi:MAG: hypothetical protein WBF17_13155 [Phycisphaerae bacterium]